MLEMRAGVAAQMGADRDVLQHASCPGTSLTCWKVRAMPSLTISCGGALSMLLPSTEILPPEAVSTPVIRLKVVLLPAPLGPISATISRAWTSNETSLTAITPPNCLRALSICSSAPGAAAGRSRARQRAAMVSGRLRARLERQTRHQPRPDPGRRQLQQQHQQDAEHDGLELALAVEQHRQIALQDLLQDDDDAGARAPRPRHSRRRRPPR